MCLAMLWTAAVLELPFQDLIKKAQRILWFDTKCTPGTQKMISDCLFKLSGYYRFSQMYCEVTSVLNSKKFVNKDWNSDLFEKLGRNLTNFQDWRKKATEAFDRNPPDNRIQVKDKKGNLVTINNRDQNFFTDETADDFECTLKSAIAWNHKYTSWNCFVREKDITQDHLENEFNLIRSQVMNNNGKVTAAQASAAISILSFQNISRREKRQRAGRGANTSLRAQDMLEESSDDDEVFDNLKKQKLDLVRYYKQLPPPPNVNDVRKEVGRSVKLDINVDFLKASLF
jgi:hypothetical protein